MADMSESPDTPPGPAPDAQPEAPAKAPSAQERAKRKGTRSPALAPAIRTRGRLTKNLGSSLREHEAEVTRALEEVLSPFLEDGERLELTSLLRVVGRLVEDRQERLERAHREHHKERTADKQRQQETRRWFKELRRRMVDLRQNVRSLYGRTVVKEYLGLVRPTGREPLFLLAQARSVLETLQDRDRPRPKPRFGDQSLDWDWWVDKLEPPTRALQQAVYDQDHEARETESFHRAKELELEGYDRQVHAAARWIAATFELADRKSFGIHLRPFARNRLRRSKTESAREPGSEPTSRGVGKGTGESPTPPAVSET